MIICHASDCHWNFEQYPWADLYIFTGDLLRNFPVRVNYGWGSDWGIDLSTERIKQKLSMDALQNTVNKAGKKGFAQYFGNPDAPIIAVRGNHDFVDIAPLFADCNFRHEFFDNEVITVKVGGQLLSATGHRGIPSIAGEWSDETPRPDLIDKFKRMPTDLDLYLTHYSPQGISTHYEDGAYGLEQVLNWASYNFSKRPLWMCGHLHQLAGTVMHTSILTVSNAATTYNLLEGEPGSGWTDISPL